MIKYSQTVLRRGYVLAMRLLQSDIKLDAEEAEALCFFVKHEEDPPPIISEEIQAVIDAAKALSRDADIFGPGESTSPTTRCSVNGLTFKHWFDLDDAIDNLPK